MSTRPPILVFVVGLAFVLLIAALLIGSLAQPEFPAYALTAPHPRVAGDTLLGAVTYTLDASSTEQWRRFDFGRGAVVDSGGWDLAFRRFHLIAAPGGGILDLGPAPFDSVRELPASGYLPNTTGPDTTNPGPDECRRYRDRAYMKASHHPLSTFHFNFYLLTFNF